MPKDTEIESVSDVAHASEVQQVIKIDGREIELIARRRNELILANHHLSYQAYRLFMYVLSQVKNSHDENTDYEFSVYEIANQMGISRQHLYGTIVEALDELASKIVNIPVLDDNGQQITDTFVRVGLIKNKQKVKRGKDGEIAVGSISVSLHKELLPYVTNIQRRFTDMELKHLFMLKSAYTQRLYEQLRMRAFTGQDWKVGKTELREILGVEDGKFELWGDFRRFILEKAQKEIAETDLPFELDYVNVGRKVTDVIFKMSRPKERQVGALPGSREHSVLREMLDLGLSTADGEALLRAWWVRDPGRLTWHIAEARKRFAVGKVKNTRAWFKAAVAEDYRPEEERPQPKDLQHSVLAKRDVFRKEEESKDTEVRAALGSLGQQFAS